MPKGSAVADVEQTLKQEYGSNNKAVFGTLNKIGLMQGNKPTAKGLLPAKSNVNGRISKHMQRMRARANAKGTL